LGPAFRLECLEIRGAGWRCQTISELLLRDVEPAIVAWLKAPAGQHRCSVEDEHRAILRDLLLAGDQEPPELTFEAYLRTMPDVGTDGDFSRIEGSIRDVSLAE